MPTQKSIGKLEIRPTPCKIITPKNCNFKLCTWLCQGNYPPCNFGFNR